MVVSATGVPSPSWFAFAGTPPAGATISGVTAVNSSYVTISVDSIATGLMGMLSSHSSCPSLTCWPCAGTVQLRLVAGVTTDALGNSNPAASSSSALFGSHPAPLFPWPHCLLLQRIASRAVRLARPTRRASLALRRQSWFAICMRSYLKRSHLASCRQFLRTSAARLAARSVPPCRDRAWRACRRFHSAVSTHSNFLPFIPQT